MSRKSRLKIKKYGLISIIIVLMILFSPLNENKTFAIAESGSDSSPSLDSSNDPQSTGSPRNVTEYATYLKTENINTPQNVTTIFPLDWKPYKVSATINNLVDTVNDSIQDPSFDTVTGYWTSIINDTIVGDEQPDVYTGITSISSDQVVYVSMVIEQAWWGDIIEEGEYGAWLQNITFNPRGSVHEAWLSFNYRWVETYVGQNMANLEIFAKVATRDQFNMSSFDVFTVSLVETMAGSQNTWIPVNASVPSSYLNFPDNRSITVMLGVRVVAEISEDWITRPYNWTVYFDDVQLIVVSEVNASQVGLSMSIGSQTVNFTDQGWGSGNASLTGEWSENVTILFDSTWSYPVMGTLNVVYHLVFRSITDSVTFSVTSGSNVSWTVIYTTQRLTEDYTNRCFKVFLPVDWNISQVKAPDNREVPVHMLNITIVDGTKVLEIPKDQFQYGTWKFYISSPNYVKQVKVLYSNGTFAGVTPNFYVNTSIKVATQILNSSDLPPANVGKLNVTIYDPSENIWSFNVITSLNDTGWGITSPLLISGSNSSAGEYSAEMFWSNGEEVGYLVVSILFTVTHRTSLVIQSPVKTQVYYGDLVLISVQFLDEDTGNLIRGATVKCNWTTGERNFTDIGTGEYETTFNTSELGIGRFTFIITAQKAYYDSANITLTLDIYYRTVLSSPQAPEYGVPIPIGDNLTVDLYYERADTRAGITGASIAANGTWNDRILDVEEPEAGHYVVYFNTTGLGAGYHTIELMANKSFYEAKKITIRFLFVYKTKYSPESLAIYVGYNENFTVWFKYMYYNGSPVLGANVTVYIEWLDQWITMTDTHNDGNYTAEVNASAPMATVYSLRFRANKTLHQSWEVSPVTVVIWERHTLLEVIYPTNLTLSVTWLENGTVRVNYLDAVTQGGIANATVKVDWSGSSSYQDLNNGTYIVEISTKGVDVGTYMLTITFDTPTYTINSTSIQVIVEERETYLVAPSSLSVTWLENGTVRVEYRDANGTGIPGANITVDWADKHWVNRSLEQSGTYVVEIETDSLTAAGTYTLMISVHAPNYAISSKTIQVTVNERTVNVTVQPSTLSVTWLENATVTIQYLDNETRAGIANATVSVSWPPEAYWVNRSQEQNGTYIIEISTKNVNAGTYTLTVTLDTPTYEVSSVSIQVIVEERDTTITAQPSTLSVTWLENGTVRVEYRDANGTGIPGATVSISWSGGHWVNRSQEANGIYMVEISTKGVDVGTYSLIIRIDKTNYAAKSITIQVIIGERETQVEVVFPADLKLNVTWSESVNVTVVYRDANGTGILGANITVTWGSSWNYHDLQNGTYIVEITTSEIPIAGTHSLMISFKASNYKVNFVMLEVKINEKASDIEVYPENLMLTVSWLENATIKVNYLDNETRNGISGASVIVTWVGSYYVDSSLNNGTYIIEISTREVTVAGNYSLTIVLDTPVYISRSVRLFVVVLRQESDVNPRLLELTVAWGDIKNITITYINNMTSEGVPGAYVNYNMTSFALREDYGNGTYVIEFDSSRTNVGNYTVLVVFDSAMVKPATCVVKIHVVEVSTELTVTIPKEPVPVGDLFNFTVLYYDLNHSRGVEDALIMVDWPYGYEIEVIGGGKYEISLVTKNVPIGEYNVSISAFRQNYMENSKLITVRIRLIKMRIDAPSLTKVYFTQLGNLTIQVWDDDHDIVIDYATITSNLTGILEIKGKGNGTYIITFDTRVLDVRNYTVQIQVSKPNYETKTVTVIVEILPIPTSYRLYIIGANITGQVISVIEGGTFNITVEYIDTLHDEKIEGATVYLVFPNGTEIALYEVDGGNYTIKIDTHELETKTYNITLVLSKSRYQEQRIQLYLRVESKPVVPTKVLLMGLLTGSGVAAGIFALAASWYFYFRFPAFVRLTRSISKRLIKGKSPKFGKVREREEIIRDLIRRDYGTVVPPSFLEKPEVEVEVPEVEEVSEELVEAGEETLKEVAETIETLTGIEAPRELKRLLEEKKKEVEEKEEKIEKEEGETEEEKED